MSEQISVEEARQALIDQIESSMDERYDFPQLWESLGVGGTLTWVDDEDDEDDQGYFICEEEEKMMITLTEIGRRLGLHRSTIRTRCRVLGITPTRCVMRDAQGYVRNIYSVTEEEAERVLEVYSRKEVKNV